MMKKIILLKEGTGFNRIINGVEQPRNYKIEKSLARLNKNTSQLEELKYGKIYSFNEATNKLIIGKASYQKIK